jgi:hypothetical protein
MSSKPPLSKQLSKQSETPAVEAKPAVNLKRRSLKRLYGYNKSFLIELGEAFLQSRMNFFGPGEYIKLEDLERVTGVSSSVINSIEHANRDTASIDNIVSLWAFLGQGKQPPRNPRTQLPYTWLDFFDMLELNHEVAGYARTFGITVLNWEASSIGETMENRLLALIALYQEQQQLQALSLEELAQHLASRAKITPFIALSLLREQLALEDMSPREARLLASILPNPLEAGAPWGFEQFVLYISGRKLKSTRIRDSWVTVADCLNGLPPPT